MQRETIFRYHLGAPPNVPRSMWAGAAGCGTQGVILALVPGTALPTVLSTIVGGGLVAVLLMMAWRLDHPPTTTVLRHAVPAAGIGGLAMLLGPGLDALGSQPPGTHAGWSLAAMVVACWCLCDAPAPPAHSPRWNFACRMGVLLGMLLGMAVAHTMLAGHVGHAVHTGHTGHTGHAPGPETHFAFAHLAMVAAMTVGSTLVAVTLHRLARKLQPAQSTPK